MDWDDAAPRAPRRRVRVRRRNRPGLLFGVPFPRIPRKVPGAELACKRTFYLEHWQPSTTTVNNFWRYYQFTLSQLPSAADFTNLFDAYKISAIKLTFRPRFDNFAGNDTTDTTIPGITNNNGTMVHVIKDPRSTVVPSGTYTSATLNSYLENGSVQTHQGIKPINIYWTPMVDVAVATGASAFPRSRSLSRYLNTNNTDVVHYGCHVFMQDANFTGLFGNAYDVFVTYYMKFKNLK